MRVGGEEWERSDGEGREEDGRGVGIVVGVGEGDIGVEGRLLGG